MLRGRLFKDILSSAEMVSKRGTKHWDIKWSQKRKEKFYKVDLPDFDKVRRQMKLPHEEQKSIMKKEGKMPPRYHQERPIIISCTNSIFEPYVPPEGGSLMSNLTKGAKEKMTELQMKRKSFMAVRKIKSYDEDFDVKEFPDQALSIYKEAMHLLQDAKKNELKLHELLSEKAYPELVLKLSRKTLRWAFDESMEAARVVHVRSSDFLSKDNIFAQITVRFLTKQKIAIYDQYGRLMYGSASKPRERLEFVVFEKHISDEEGVWRMHGKLQPLWTGVEDEGVLKTIMLPYAQGDPRAEEVSDGAVIEAL